jgi:hypothetical protein
MVATVTSSVTSGWLPDRSLPFPSALPNSRRLSLRSRSISDPTYWPVPSCPIMDLTKANRQAARERGICPIVAPSNPDCRVALSLHFGVSLGPHALSARSKPRTGKAQAAFIIRFQTARNCQSGFSQKSRSISDVCPKLPRRYSVWVGPTPELSPG